MTRGTGFVHWYLPGGNDVPYWTEFLRALAEIDPDMAVNIEHEDAAYSQTEGLALAAKNLHSAAAAL